MRADTLYATNPASINKGIIISDTLKLLNFTTTNSSGLSTDSILTISNNGYVRKVALSRLKDSISYWANARGWQLAGNTGSNPASDFIGTTDVKDMVFKTNNTERLRMTAGGDINMTGGTLNINNSTDLESAIGSRVSLLSLNNKVVNKSSLEIFTNRFALGQDWGSASLRIQQKTDWDEQGYIEFKAGGITLGTYNTPYITMPQSGRMGIGTTDPASTLDVNGTIYTTNLRIANGATANSIATSSNSNGDVTWKNPTSSNIVWSISGNSGTTAGTHFIGTTDAKDLIFKTSNTERMKMASGGGISVTGALSTTTSLTAGNGLTVSAGGASITGSATVSANASITGTLTTTGATSLNGGTTTTTLRATTVAAGSTTDQIVSIDASGNIRQLSIIQLANMITSNLFTSPANTNICTSCGPNGINIWVSNADETNTAAWGYAGIPTGATSAADGRFNTNRLPLSDAAMACTSKGTGWYLPSSNELSNMVPVRAALGNNFQNTWYFSSTEWTATDAVMVNPTNGLTGTGANKPNPQRIRCVWRP